MAVAVVAGECVRDGGPSHPATKPPSHQATSRWQQQRSTRPRTAPSCGANPKTPENGGGLGLSLIHGTRCCGRTGPVSGMPKIPGRPRLVWEGCAVLGWNGMEWNAGLRETVLRYFHSASRAIRARSAVGGGSTQPYLADGQKPLSRTMVQKTRVCRVQCLQTGQRKILLFHTLHDITLHYITWHSMALHDTMEVMVAR